MGEQTIQILNVTRQELLEIIKEGIKCNDPSIE